jgi:hypothetical protein
MTGLVCAGLTLSTSTHAAVSGRLSVHVSIEQTDLVPRPILATAVAEAAALWAVYHIDVDWPNSDPQVDCDPLHETVKVLLTPEERLRDRDRVLGEAVLDDGKSNSLVVLHYLSVMRTANDAKVFGEHSPFWPAAVRDQIIGRAMGRVLAHELGHVLLHRRQHSPAGLMQAGQAAARLASPIRDAFVLTTEERERLSDALGALAANTRRRDDCVPFRSPHHR